MAINIQRFKQLCRKLLSQITPTGIVLFVLALIALGGITGFILYTMMFHQRSINYYPVQVSRVIASSAGYLVLGIAGLAGFIKVFLATRN